MCARRASTIRRRRASSFASAGPHRSQRRRDAGRCGREATARFSILTQAEHMRGRVVAVLQEQLRQAGITVDLVAARSGRALPAVHAGQLRQHLLRHPGERDRSRAEPRVLAQLRRLSLLEPGAEDAGDRLGAAHRRIDAGPGDDADLAERQRPSPRSSASSPTNCPGSTS